MKGKELFFHRLFRNHTWETLDEKYVEGLNIERTGVKVWGFNAMGQLQALREGYWLIHQKCTVCGDRRTIKK